MAVLPPDLTEELVIHLAPLFRRGEDRDARLIPVLNDWEEYDDIIWGGSGRAFTARLVRQLPDDRLQAVLEALQRSDNLDTAQVKAWGERIVSAALLLNRAAGEAVVSDPLVGYHRLLAERWSGSRYQLDSRFVQLTLLLDQGPEAIDMRFKPDPQRERYDSLDRLLKDVPERAVALLGRPGSGKTTLLRRLQLENAWQELAQPSGRTSLFVYLNSYRGVGPNGDPPPPLAWLRTGWQAAYPNLPDFDELFWHGRFLFLLDGLNEIPHRDHEEYEMLVGAWQSFWQRYAHLGNTAVFSCRSLDYSVPLTSEAAPVWQVQVEPLTPAQCQTFITAYLPDQAEEVWAALRQERQQLELFATPFFLQLLVEQVAETGEMPSGQAGLLTGFVRRALHREAVERKHRLFAPGALLSRHDRQQVIHRAWGGLYGLPNEGLLLPKLAALAHAMQSGRESGARSQVRLPISELRQLLLQLPLDPAHLDDFIDAGIELNALDKTLEQSEASDYHQPLEVSFYHQLLQEYFAARILARQPEPGRVQTAWRAEEMPERLQDWLARANVSDLLPTAPTTGWEETTLLAVAMTANQEQFVTDLMAANLPLAARCAAAPDVTVSPTLVARLQEELLARIGDPEADLRARIAAAEALGELGDPRFERRTGPYGDYLLPPTAPIPGGTYIIGADDSKYDDEKPAHPVPVDDFAMAVFPVTNAEYRLFMAAGAYEDEQWWETEAARAWLRGEGSSEGRKQAVRDLKQQLQDWTEDGLKRLQAAPDTIDYWIWLKNVGADELEQELEKAMPTGKVYRQPEYWEDGRFNHPSRPVVGITWFEARAYCAWLSAQTGDSCRLPTEAEWEAAARGQARREYAFGERYDPAHCNTFETHIRRTTPMGVFPGGKTPEGIYDLSGNVWEWTSTIWGKSSNEPDYPYPYDGKDGREDPEDGASRRVLRGGSFHYNADSARAAYRNFNVPGFRLNDFGFRVVVVRRSCARNGLLSQ